MTQTAHRAQETDGDRQPKWFNSPVTSHEGTLTDIRKHIPAFERRPFGLPLAEGEIVCPNKRLDTIVRLPFGEDKTVIPVGVVSKDYALVPHTRVLDEATKALEAANIALSEVKTELMITEYGERMAVSLYLPDKYRFDPGDGHPMALRLECLNSVDGSTRFRALMGWFRFVCSNGLIIGVTRFDMRRRHIGDFQIEDIWKVLASGLNESEAEKKNFEKWRKSPITPERLAAWSDDALRKVWGFKAAARLSHRPDRRRRGYCRPVQGQHPYDYRSTHTQAGSGRAQGIPDSLRRKPDTRLAGKGAPRHTRATGMARNNTRLDKVFDELGKARLTTCWADEWSEIAAVGA
ncbi:MAG: DUF932 domain-containing protein [Opitutaceae bacterium]|nr:DUF932 domain-containing protein [Opitutaceae bacterium]